MGYVPNINHGVLIKLAEHRKDLEKKTKPIMDTLRSYQDLPPVFYINKTKGYIYYLMIVVTF